MFDRKPVVVRGPVSSGVARVVADDTQAVIVTQRETVHLALESPLVQTGTNKWKAATSGETELTVVVAGGCTCGKPWLKKGTGSELLAGDVVPTALRV